MTESEIRALIVSILDEREAQSAIIEKSKI